MKKYIGVQSGSTIHGSSLYLRKDGTFAYRPQIKVTKTSRFYRMYKSIIYLFLSPLP